MASNLWDQEVLTVSNGVEQARKYTVSRTADGRRYQISTSYGVVEFPADVVPFIKDAIETLEAK